MNEKIDILVDEIIEIEKNSIRKKFDVQSGKGTQYARTKADADAVNGIINLIDSITKE